MDHECGDPVSAPQAASRTLLQSMADNLQLPPPGGPAGYSAVAVPPEGEPGRALLTAVLLVGAGVVLGLIGGVIWAAVAPRVVYQVYTLSPPTAYAVNPETSAFIAADGIYTFVALGGGALLGLTGYLFGVRRYGPVPMVGVVLGAIAAAFVAQWLGPVLTGQDSFNARLGSSKPGALIESPIALGSHGALAFWPVAAAIVAGGLEMLNVMRLREAGQHGPGPHGPGHHRLGQPGPGSAGRPPAPGASDPRTPAPPPPPAAWPEPAARHQQPPDGDGPAG
jgi:hypothetical protein